VLVNEQVVTFPIKAAPSLTMEDQVLENGNLMIKAALIDAHGWIAVHSSVDGAPGPVIATYALPKGLSTNILISVDPAQAASQVFPMLHYDTGAAGVYEFGTVEGADGPVAVAGAVVVGPINLTGGETTAPPTTALDANALIDERCTVCHSRERIDAASKDVAGWTETVDRMIANGAQLSPEEREAVIQFLANRDAAAAPPATAIDANALIDERCTVCHSRERIDAATKDVAGWTATVDRMIGNGAQLTPEEREALIQFLSSR
jgi:cytochrome c5